MSDLNDQRVFFAAERTLLAWTRTSLTLMAFGFVIERFGLFIHMLKPQHAEMMLQRGLSFWIGLSFIVLGAVSSTLAAVQYKKVLKSLRPVEIPLGYFLNLSVFINLFVVILGGSMVVYLFQGTFL